MKKCIVKAKPIVTVLLAALLLALAGAACGCRFFIMPSDDPAASETPSGHASSKGDISAVVISEVVSSNAESHHDETYGSPDWVELMNTSGKSVDISGARLGDSPSMQNSLTFPEGTVLEPGAFITVLCIPERAPQSDPFIAPFGISRSGETICFGVSENRLSTVSVPPLETDISWARGEDGAYGYCPVPTFGSANGEVFASIEEAASMISHSDALRISELVNGANGWAEFVNDSEETILLSDYYLSDDETSPAKWRFPEAALEPHEFVTVELCTEPGEGSIAASFKLGKDEGALFLFNTARRLVDRLDFDPAMPEGVSAVRQEAGSAYTCRVTKGEENSSSTFLEIKWTPVDPGAGETRLYINEVLAVNKYSITDSFGDRSDWVELLNPTDEPVDLADYYLSDSENDLLKFRLPEITLMPHSYSVIFLSGRESGDHDGEIHAPFSLSPGESIFLASLDGMKLDRIDIPEEISPNISVGRNGNNDIRYYAAPTPGASNSTYGLEKCADAGGFNASSLYINEVSAVSPARSGVSDWVELYNGSQQTIKLDGWRLTDSIDEPNKYTLKGSLIAGGYLVITCDDGAPKGGVKAPFSVSNTGDTLYLLDPEGAVRDVFETGVTEIGVTSGRSASGDGERCFFSGPTKGSKNSSPLDGITSAPVFSTTELYHSSSFELKITCPTPDVTIRYTTDGTLPTSSSKRYSEPVRISSNTVVTARAFKEGWATGPAACSTYLFGTQHTLPVVCLSLSSSDYSRMYKAQVTPNGGVIKGDEVACRMEYYIGGRLAFSGGAGVRVSGASTSLYSQKPLGLYFRAGYGRSSVEFPLFEGSKIKSFRSLTLRNSGQDAYYAHMRDAYISRICAGLNVDVSAVQPVIVYINGQYRGVYDLKENMNEDFVASHHNVPRGKVEIIRRNGHVVAGSNTNWYEMFDMCKNLDCSKQENYERLCRLVDVDCVIDHLIARTYFYDWDMYNQKYWHTSDNKVKWRPVLYDSDYMLFGNNVNGSVLARYFDRNGVASAHGFITKMDLFCALNSNKEWREKFITRYIYVVKYRFNKTKALAAFDKLYNEYAPEMQAQINKWHMPSSYEVWKKETTALRNCLAKRPEAALRILRNYYGLTDSQYAQYERAADRMAGN